MSKIKNITFLKAFLFEDSLPPIYNKISNENGVVFKTKDSSDFDFKNQILKIKDVPDYLNIETITIPQRVSLNKVKTLKGHLVELSTLQNISDYLKLNFSAKSRSNFRRYQNRLETCFNIKYVTYYGYIEKKEYNKLFIVLKDLLLRRFNEKKEKNYELQHLGEFENIIYDMLLQKKASLFVIYHNNKPISIRINMHKNTLSYYIISGYDIDYSKFHLGAIDMLKNIEWCINNNFEIYDLLKGYDYYKTKWSTKSHYYYNHIAYSSNKTNTLILGKYISIKEKIKYRFYNVFKKYNLIFKLKKIKKYIYGMKNTSTNNHVSLSISNLKDEVACKVITIDIEKNNEYTFLRKPLYDFLFLNNYALNSVTVYKLADFSNKFLIKSNDKNLVISVNGTK